MDNEPKKLEKKEQEINLTLENLKNICEVMFDNKPHEMISKVLKSREKAKQAENKRLFNLINIDLNTIIKEWRNLGGSNISIRIDDKIIDLNGVNKK